LLSSPERTAHWERFVADLRVLAWELSPAERHAHVRQALDRLATERSFLPDLVASWRRQLADIADGSHETSTHYKWLCHRDPERRFTVWLHQYKPTTMRRPGHANVAHNHRYDFSSLILVGALTEQQYAEPATPPLRLIDERTLTAGQTYSVLADEIHAMSGIEDGTLTLVVEGAPVRHHSRVYDVTTGDVTCYPDFIEQYDALTAAVEGLSDA